MIKDKQDRFWRLCPEDLYCKVVAENRSELDELLQGELDGTLVSYVTYSNS